MVNKFSLLLKYICLMFIHCYRYALSPLLGCHCRFYPSCSRYAVEAIEQYGVIKGLILTVKRLCCCHPWHRGGYDPVPCKMMKVSER